MEICLSRWVQFGAAKIMYPFSICLDFILNLLFSVVIAVNDVHSKCLVNAVIVKEFIKSLLKGSCLQFMMGTFERW